jgi:RNA polymerase sigma factor (sigma-70 family)
MGDKVRTRKPPPPPGWDSRQSPYELDVLTRWDVRIRRMSRRVWHTHKVGMDADDVYNEIREAVLLAVRRYTWKEGECPPDPFINVVARRRKLHIIRAINAGMRDHEWLMPVTDEDGEDVHPDITDTADPVDEVLSCMERDDGIQGLTYALRRNLPPAAFAILHLRYVDEMSPGDIAELVGIPGKTDTVRYRRAAGRIASAKLQAMDFLKTLGIQAVDQIDEEVYDGID